MSGTELRDRLVAVTLVTTLLVACGQDATHPTPTSGSSPASSPDAAAIGLQNVDVGGYELGIYCEGSGTPTVVFEAGLGGDLDSFDIVSPDIQGTTRVCSYGRAGIGFSDPRPASVLPATGGDAARELDRLLAGADVEGPVVIVAHSFGGMVAQLFVDRYPDRVAGVVLVDSALAELISPNGGYWEETPVTRIDMLKTRKELEAVGSSYGDIPTVVLTANCVDSGTCTKPQLRSGWSLHDLLAARSSDSIHVFAVNSGHSIQEDEPDLVIAAIEEVLQAVRNGQPLEACDDRFAAVGGECAV